MAEGKRTFFFPALHCYKKDSDTKVALIAAILLNKRAARRNYTGDDTAPNEDINYMLNSELK